MLQKYKKYTNLKRVLPFKLQHFYDPEAESRLGEIRFARGSKSRGLTFVSMPVFRIVGHMTPTPSRTPPLLQLCFQLFHTGGFVINKK